jgi:dienelactone hydrolase
MRRILFFLSLAVSSVQAHASGSEAVSFPGRGPDAPILKADLFRPSGNGPHPVIVALHGCGGNYRADGTPIARVQDWTERWLAAGYAVLWPDSFGSRGLGAQCTAAKRMINPAGRAFDAMAAVDWLGRQPGLDAQRVALVGWSNGAGTALRAASVVMAPATVELRTVIAFYPGCRPLLESRLVWTPRVPVTILMGGADDWTPPEPCRDLGLRQGVRYVEYPDAYHDFDAPNAPIRVRTGLTFSADKSGRAHVGTNPKARAAAIIEVMDTLSAAFK